MTSSFLADSLRHSTKNLNKKNFSEKFFFLFFDVELKNWYDKKIWPKKGVVRGDWNQISKKIFFEKFRKG